MAKQPLLSPEGRSSRTQDYDPRASFGIRSSAFNLAPQNLACSSMDYERKRPKRVSHYVLGPILGEGSYGVVRDAIDTSTLRRVAIKCIKPGFRQHTNAKRIEQQLVTEVEYLQRFHHENLVRALDIFCSAQGRDYMVLPVALCSLQQLLNTREEELLRDCGSVASGTSEVIQYSPAGSAWNGLGERSSQVASVGPMSSNYGTHSPNIKELPEGASFLQFTKKRLVPAGLAKDIIYQVLQGLAYMHKQNLAHNDVKPENVLLFADGTVKLTDFGSIGSELAAGGTPAYISPEGTGVADDGAQVCPKANDVWACGVMLYQLCTNKLPFTGTSEFHLYNNIVNQQIDFTQVIESDGVMPLLKGMLEKDPKKRLTAERALRSQWLVQGLATSSFMEERKNSEQDGSRENLRRDVSTYNIRRVFDISDIAAMKELDIARHKQFVHEIRFILGLPVTNATSKREMNDLTGAFLSPEDFSHYSKQGDPDSDVRSLRDDSLKLGAIAQYCSETLDDSRSKSRPKSGSRDKVGERTKQRKTGCPCIIC